MLLRRGDEVTLNENERRLARWMAREREDKNLAAGKTRKVVGRNLNGYLQNLMGAGAEIAHCKRMNTYFEVDTSLRVGGYDPGLHSGETVATTAGTYAGRPLLNVHINKVRADADVYALWVWLDPADVTDHAVVKDKFSIYRFIGWEFAEHVLVPT